LDQSNPLYYLQAIRSWGDQTWRSQDCAFASIYHALTPHVACQLADACQQVEYDAVVCAPTTSYELVGPYHGAILGLRATRDLTTKIERSDSQINSSSDHSFEQRVEALGWNSSLNWGRYQRILLIDDFLSRGRTIAPLVAPTY
jgi:adenine/guanine phosphoribosyltransferase-like PRPP-binding protein